MDARQRESLHSLQRAAQFLDDHAEVLSVVNRSPARAELDHAVRQAQEAATMQEETETRTRSLTHHKNMLRRKLLRHNLGPIVRMVRGRPRLFSSAQDTRMPRKGASDAEVMTCVYAVLRWAPEHREKLVAQGLRPDFIEALRDAVEEFASVIAERCRYQLRHIDATATIPGVLADAWTSVGIVGALIDDGEGARNLFPVWRAAQLHAPRTAALGAGGLPHALPTAPASPPAPPPRRGLLRVIARVLNPDRAA